MSAGVTPPEPPSSRAEFGARVRALREQAGLSLRQLEASTGVSNAYLSQIESGRVGAPSPKILERLAETLGTSYLELLNAAGHLGPATVNSVIGLAKSTVDVSELSEDDRSQVVELVRKLKMKRAAKSKVFKGRRRD